MNQAKLFLLMGAMCGVLLSGCFYPLVPSDDESESTAPNTSEASESSEPTDTIEHEADAVLISVDYTTDE